MAAASGHLGLDHKFVHAILDRGPQALPDLVRFAGRDRTGDLVDLEEDLIALFRYLRTPEAIPFLIELVRKQPEDIPDDIVQALVEIGEPAVEPLLKLYGELDAEDNDLPFILASLRVHDPRVLEILVDRLAYDPVDAAFCLELYGDEAARPAIESTIEGIKDDDPEIRRSMEEALEQVSKPQPAPVLDSFDIWDAYPVEDTPHLDLLSEQEKLAFLDSSDPAYRAAAAHSLAKAPVSEKVRARLRRLAEHDEDPKVRAECWETLGPACLDDTALREKMLERLSDASAPLVERYGALVGLAANAGDPRLDRWVLEFYENPEARPKALEAMWRSFDPRYADYFVKHLDDTDVDIQREAVWGIGHLRIQSEAARLRELFEHDELRSDALYNYAVAWPGEITRSRARSMLRRIEEWAGGLSMVEAEIVQTGIDERLAFEGHRPVFSLSEAEQEVAVAGKTGRNDACPCGSGKKYKKCCGS